MRLGSMFVKIWGLFILSVVVFIAVVVYVISFGVDKYEDRTLEFERNVTEKVLIDGDTLTIVDYSLINGTYILSDGGEIHERFIKDNILE